MSNPEKTSLLLNTLSAMRDYVGRAVAPLVEEMLQLRTRLTTVESRAAQPGPQGEKGDPGVQGERGVAGETGTPGAEGPRGETGPQGEPGPKGEKGDRGEPGPQGEPGTPGEAGAPGAKGDPGVAGEPGPRGEKGDPGQTGERGEKGQPGDPGVAGEPGPRGEKGDPGEQGKDGRDALELDVLPSLDVARSYRRGTYAALDGGVVKAYRETDPLSSQPDPELAGWVVVLRGVANFAVDVDEDGRTLTVTHRHTCGRPITKSLEVPTMVYRGVWRQAEYAKGDTVTWDGSLWVASATTADKPGVGETVWRLAAKRGRDGKDGQRGERGERGAEGRAGKDLTQMAPDGRKW